jgi:SAM-dependent methyltransferase
MSGFSLDWLGLREPFDRAARNEEVRRAALALLADRAQTIVVDLACGAGSTLRALAPDLAKPQRWRLVDNDPALLAAALAAARDAPDVMVETMPFDLNGDLASLFTRDVSLVTTSALLDLVSQTWIERLADGLAARRLPFYAALSYDGRATLDPVHPRDAEIVTAVNRHQRGDKGFGPALGPDGARTAIAALRSRGYRVVSGSSDWRAAPPDRAFQSEILRGWAQAAREIGQGDDAAIDAWLAQRTAWIDAGASSLTVGHVDFLGMPGE